MNKNSLIGAITLLLSFLTINSFSKSNVPFVNIETKSYANQIIKKLSINEKIGQIFMLAVHPNKGEKHFKKIDYYITKYKIGGLVIFKTDAKKFITLINRFQSLSKIPLLICIDGEWGLNMRITDVERFPYNSTLGAIKDNNLIYKMSCEMAKQFKLLGIHVNFAPVIDINNNPNNPIIGFRSFSDNKKNVAQKGIAYMKGLQDNNILAVAKHFPGHGDTDVDSHKNLPLLKHSLKRINSFELYPFKKIIDAGVGGIMAGHLSVPSLDSTGLPASLSSIILKNKLRKELGFEGLIFSDAMNMGGITNLYNNGELKAFEAGIDIIEYPNKIVSAIKDIKNAIFAGQITQETLNKKCIKLLMLKKWVGANKKKLSYKNIISKLNNKSIQDINRKLFDNSITLLRNNNNLIPINKNEKIACITLGRKNSGIFQNELAKKTKNLTTYFLNKFKPKQLKNILESHTKIIISIHNISKYRRNKYSISQETIKIVNYLLPQKNTIFLFYCNPYALTEFKNIQNFSSVAIAYQETKYSHQSMVKLIFGDIRSKGKLPFRINKFYKYGDGIDYFSFLNIFNF